MSPAVLSDKSLCSFQIMSFPCGKPDLQLKGTNRQKENIRTLCGVRTLGGSLIIGLKENSESLCFSLEFHQLVSRLNLEAEMTETIVK